MQDLDQHMEDWFRKAADACPIRVPPSDWEQIATRLTGISESRKRKKERKWILIILLSALLISTGIIMLEFFPYSTKSINRVAVQVQDPLATTEQKKEIIENTLSHTQMETKKDKLNKRIPSHRSIGLLPGNTFPESLKGDLMNSSNLPGIFGKDREDDQRLDLNVARVNNPSSENEIDTKEISLISTLAPSSPLEPDPELLKKPLNNSSNHPGLYWGILAGPQISFVKNQGISKPGFDVGVTIGYALSNRFSFETGLIYSRKHYTSEGKYFDMTKAASSMPQGMKIMSLEGSSSMFELPLRLKIVVLSGKKSGIYLSSGISSQLIIHESNQYSALVNGSPEQMTGTYPKNTLNFASSINIGAGFEHAVGKRGMIRFEPYVNLPLKGTGVGNMPVTSAGLRFNLIQFTK